MTIVKRLVPLMILPVLVLSGCGPSGPQEDASAILACDHFRNIMGDIGNGILSGTEIRDKMKQVYSDAQGSTTSGIVDDARLMLADATEGNKVTLLGDAFAFSGDCKTIGH